YAGRVIESGPTREVLSNPKHWYTAALLESIPSIRNSRRVKPIQGTPASPATRPTGCAFHPRCPAATSLCATVVPPSVTIPSSTGSRTLACHHPRDEVPA